MNSFPQNASEYKYNQVLPTTVNLLNVKSLKVNSLHYVEEFLVLNRLTAFSQLRSVYLNNVFVHRTTYAKLLDQLASLKSLHSLSIAIRTFHDTEVYFYSVHEENLATAELTDIFLRSVFLEQRIPSLKYLQLHEDVIRLPLLSSSLTEVVSLTMKLEHLTMDGLYFDVLIKLVPYLQQVKSIRIGHLKFSNNIIIPHFVVCQTVNAHAEQLLNCTYFNASVELNSNTKEFEQIEFLLKLLPVVEQLHLGEISASALNTSRWDFLISNFCPKLLKLMLSFVNSLPFQEDAEDAVKTLNNTSFWLNHQTKSTYDEHHRCNKFNIQFDLNL